MLHTMGGETLGGFPEGNIPATEAARAELCAELAGNVQLMAAELTSAEIAADPVLDAMITKLTETGPELDPDIRAHLRKMVAWRVGGLLETGIQAGYDAEFFRMVESHVDAELMEMAEFEEDLSDVPDLWQLAYDDLVTLTHSVFVDDELENDFDFSDGEPEGDDDADWEQLPDEFTEDDL